MFFTLIETEERGPRVYTEKLAEGMRTRPVPPGCNTTSFLSAARSLFLIRPSVLSRRLKLTGSRTRRFRAFALSLRRLVSARIHQVAFSRGVIANVKERRVPGNNKAGQGWGMFFRAQKVADRRTQMEPWKHVNRARRRHELTST